MKHNNIITTITFFVLGMGNLYAQQTPTSTGGNATGAGGTTSYSVGQVVFTTNTGANSSVTQGVQQPYEISTSVGINETSINLELSVYPNPTTNYLTLKTEEDSNLSYQLYDLQGKLIESKPINNTTTDISLKEQPNASYFLNVVKNNQLVKTFKVIKN